MNETIKKYGRLVLAVLCVLAIIGAALYLYLYFTGNKNSGQTNGVQDFFSALFPFGNPAGPSSGGTNGTGGTEGEGGAVPRLRQITSSPVAGFGIVVRGGNEYVQYADRATGNIYETPTDTIGNERISLTTIPRIQEASWIGDGKMLLRYLDDQMHILTFNGVVNRAASSSDPTVAIPPGDLTGAFLPEDIASVSVRPDGGALVYSIPRDEGSDIYTATAAGGVKTLVASVPFREINVQWAAPSVVIISTNAAAGAPGSIMTLDPVKKTLAFVDRGNGLTAKGSGDGKGLVAARSGSARPFVLQGEMFAGTLAQTPVRTLPEKCAYASASSWYCGVPISMPSSGVPENWYQGALSFNDDVWLVDSAGGYVQFVEATSQNVPGGLDLMNPRVAPKNDYLVFMNKDDLSLWSLQLAAPATTTASSSPAR